MYYGMIIGSVILFGTSFFFQDEYRKIRGSSLKISMQYSIPGTIAGLFILLIINRFCLSFTPFTLIMAVVNSVNGLLMGFCSFKALGKINLSLFSVFCMLGGMVLPFLQGICFYGEPLTVSKILCFMLIVAALMLTVEKSDKKSGAIYYMGVFVLNGMSGVITKLFNELPFEKADAASYSMLSAIATIVLASAVLLIFFRTKGDEPKTTPKAYIMSASSGGLSRIANFLLVIALTHVDASVQYPMVTGGTMIVSTIYCLIGGVKPKKKEILSVIVAFLGMLMLIF
ncbi:MAG: hypothetical protein IJN39_03635 [Clostridia bacterium]|nr:hypothetical protein [Clostridia bacterium]